jgi:lysophospholipase L1-like esterase
VVCAGDSITRGAVSSNYVRLLQERFPQRGIEFINAGVNGDLAWNVLERLDQIIACRPDVVTLLVGTNDVNATLRSGNRAFYRFSKRLPQAPAQDWYSECIDAILKRLTAETSASVAALDIPMLGENLGSDANHRIEAYNSALREVAAIHGVPCLPLHERLRALLPPGHRPPPYSGHLAQMLTARLSHALPLRFSQGISTGRGLVLLTDHIHLSDRGAEVVAELVGEFVMSGTSSPDPKSA